MPCTRAFPICHISGQPRAYTHTYTNTNCNMTHEPFSCFEYCIVSSSDETSQQARRLSDTCPMVTSSRLRLSLSCHQLHWLLPRRNPCPNNILHRDNGIQALLQSLHLLQRQSNSTDFLPQDLCPRAGNHHVQLQEFISFCQLQLNVTDLPDSLLKPRSK